MLRVWAGAAYGPQWLQVALADGAGGPAGTLRLQVVTGFTAVMKCAVALHPITMHYTFLCVVLSWTCMDVR